ncbi:MAG: hypothetical protein LBG59_02355 [Candidatus Peribacteria bacterium]|jgi:hypothetical protein|nr:hypothetical protein [Candidatus Peribacteria bacterium]
MVTSLQTQQLLNTTKQQKYDFFKNGSSSQGNPYAKYDFFANTQQNTSAAPTQKYDFFSRLEQKKAGTLSQTLPQTSSSQNEGWGKDYLDLLQNTYMKLTSDLASGGARMLGKSAEVFGYEQAAQNLKDTANGVQLKYQDWLKQNPDKIARDTSDDNWLQKGLYGLSGALTYTLPIMALNFVP